MFSFKLNRLVGCFVTETSQLCIKSYRMCLSQFCANNGHLTWETLENSIATDLVGVILKHESNVLSVKFQTDRILGKIGFHASLAWSHKWPIIKLYCLIRQLESIIKLSGRIFVMDDDMKFMINVMMNDVIFSQHCCKQTTNRMYTKKTN